MNFQEKIAVVTGAGSGIGESVSIKLAKEGSKVILVGRTESKLKAVEDKINSEYPNAAETYACDVTKEDEVNSLAEHIEKKYGNLHVIINNVGATKETKIRNITSEEWDHIITLNLKSTFLVSKVLGSLMVSASENDQNKTDRSIVNVASLSAHKAGALLPHYSSSKAAVVNFTKALANEYAPAGIRVNSVSPGFVETPLTEKGLENPRFSEAIKRHTALKRVGQPDEIANVIKFVASSEASYMTGSDVLVDGGWLIT